MFPGKWARDNGAAPVNADGSLTASGETWAAALGGVRQSQIAAGLAACLRDGLEWAPNPARFRALCLDLPTLAQAEQEMRPGRDRSPFVVLMRSLMDLHTFNTADGHAQSRMIAAAYESAMRHVSAGGQLPAAVPAIAHERPAAPVVTDREKAKAAMARAAADLGFDEEGRG